MHVRASISTTGHRRLPTRADGGLRHGAGKGLAARRAHQPRRRRPAAPISQDAAGSPGPPCVPLIYTAAT